VSRYDDPRWYEEQDNPSLPRQPDYDYFRRYPQPPAYGSSLWQNNPQPPAPDKTNRFQRAFRQVLIIGAFVVLAFFAGWFSHQYYSNSLTANTPSQKYEQLFQQAWSIVDKNYVDRSAINYQQMSYAAISAMVNSLHDTGHTRFLTPSEVKASNQQLSGKFTGIGIYLQQNSKGQLVISSTIPGSPAQKAGLKHDDIITAVNGVSVTGKDLNSMSNLIQGQAGSTVTLTIQRPGVAQPFTFRVERAVITVPNVLWYYIPGSHIAHIQVVQFSIGVSDQLKDAVTKAKQMGATKIILDLRGNPGGYLNEAVNTVSLFVNKGNVLLERDSSGRTTPVPVNGNAIDTTDQIVVLVDQHTASAAEIVAGALQDNHRATIIGEQTFGTGTVLQQYTLSDGSAIWLGIQEWLTPDGHFIRNHGITPNMKVGLSANAAPLSPSDESASSMSLQQILNSGDTQLTAAIKYLEQH
jgi:carboxyl-terminal processing protease